MALTDKIITPLKQAWSQSNKKAIKLFAVFSFCMWLGFVLMFWMVFRTADYSPGEENILLTSPVIKKTASTDGQGTDDFKPEFIEAYGTKHIEDLYAHKELMENYLKQGKITESIYHHDRIENFFKDDSTFIKQSAQILLDLGEFEKAAAVAIKGLSFTPDDQSLKTIEIMSIYRSGFIDSAVQTAEQALKLSPENPELLTALGTISIETRTGVSGNDHYLRKVLKNFPENIPALYQIGRKHRLEGDYADARSIFQKILRLDPANAKARGNLGAIHYYFNQKELALKEYEMALLLNPADFNTWYNKGELFMSNSYTSASIKDKKSFQQKAFESYQQAIKYNPEHEKANFRIGVILNGNRQYKEAIHHFELVLSKNPSDIRTLIQISTAYEELNRFPEAVDYLERAFKIDPNNLTVIQKLKLLS